MTNVKITNLKSMMIDPTNICNFRCIMCPTGNKELLKSVKRSSGMMSFELFKKIINDVSSSTSLMRLMLYKDGEPLLNPKLVDMIAYAKTKTPLTEIALTTNASLLSEEKSLELINSGLDWFRVSLEGMTAKDYRKITRTNITYKSISRNVKRFIKLKKELGKNKPLVVVQLLKTERNLKSKKRFIKSWKKLADKVFFSEVAGWDGSAGIKPPVFSSFFKQEKNRPPCLAPWFALAVNWNGKVSVCCVDWALRTVIGDFKTQTLNEIWNGKKMKEFRQMHLNKEFSNPACRNCTYWKQFLKCKNHFPNIFSRGF